MSQDPQVLMDLQDPKANPDHAAPLGLMGRSVKLETLVRLDP